MNSRDSTHCGDLETVASSFSRFRHAKWSVLSLSILFSVFANAGVGSYNGTGGGSIPDGTGASVVVNFEVFGLVGAVQTVSIDLNITHTWVGDLTATLYSPGNFASLKLFGRVGSSRTNSNGDSSNLSGLYSFSDFGSSDFWLAAATATGGESIPNGGYRATTGGTGNVLPEQRSNVGGCSSFLQLAFGGLQGLQMNGIWRLVINDAVVSDVGTVNAAASVLNFSIGPVVPEIPFFRASFENVEPTSTPNPIPPVTASSMRGNCTPGINSPTGSGLTDFVMARAVGTNVEWMIKKNDGTAAGPNLTPFIFGKDSDYFMLGDFDGDGASDPVIWSSETPGRFKVRRSTRPNDAPLELLFGQLGDDPSILADFDGDRVTDFIVYRDGTSANTTAHFLIRQSSTGLTADTSVLNSDGSVAFSIGDISGDGKADVGIQFNNGGGVGGFRMFSGTNGISLGNFNFGYSSDFVLPGQFVGSAITDIAVSRNANPGTGTFKYGFPRDMDTGVGDAFNLATGIIFGIPGDFICHGEYDGDGIVDFAVWRPSSTIGQSKFVIRRSTNTATPLEVPLGELSYYPVNNWDVH